MNDAFVPYAPLDTLKAVADGVWIVDGPEIRMSWLGLKVPFATRMTVVRLPDGALWLHSPIAPDTRLIEAIAALGPVAHLVGPNTLHYWWLPDWAERFPDAAVWLAPHLPEKAKRPLPAHRVLGDTPPAEWHGAFEQVVVSGDVLTEVDFFHRASRTAILTDLIENFEPARVKSWFWRWVIRWSGAADPDGKAPIDMRATFRRHRAAVRAAAETMIGWSPDRVILAHGRWYERDGAAELRRAFRWAF
jgi:hypothetical protein